VRVWIWPPLRAKHAALSPVLTERSRRVWAAAEAPAIGYGGIAQVARATGIAASTIQRGLRDLASGDMLAGALADPRRLRPSSADGRGLIFDDPWGAW
jgi:hypothetical protein